MTRIVHHESALLHLLLNETRDVRIAVTRRGTDAVVGIPHHSFHDEVGIVFLYHLSHSVGIVHMGILVAVVAHKAQQVLPGTGLLVARIAHYLVYGNSSLS